MMRPDCTQDDVLGWYMDAEMLVDLAQDYEIGTRSAIDALAWTLLIGWCPVLECEECLAVQSLPTLRR